MPLCIFRRKTWLFLVTASLCGVVIESKAAPDSKVKQRRNAAATVADTRPVGPSWYVVDSSDYAGALVRDSITDGTLANYVMYGSVRDLAKAQEAFSRGDVTGGIDALRYVADTVQANRDGLSYIMQSTGYSADADRIAAMSGGLLYGTYLDSTINVDGAEYTARELLYSPDGARDLRRRHLVGGLRLDPKFVAVYLDDNTDATKRNVMGMIIDSLTKSVQVSTPSGMKTVFPQSVSEQARDYVAVLLDLWDARTNADGTTMPGFATVFGIGTAEFITSLLESKQNKAFSSRVLRAVTAIYKNDIRSGESEEYARARRAASGLIRLKRLFMQFVMEKGPRVRSIYDYEELFATLMSKLADQACRSGDKLDLGSLHAKVAFRELFEEAVKKGMAEKPKMVSTWEKDNEKKP